MRQKPKLGDSQREREKKENFPVKGSNLMWSQAHSQNKGLSEYQRRASQLHTGPFVPRGGEVGLGQPEPEGKGLLQSQLQRWHLPPNCEQASRF